MMEFLNLFAKVKKAHAEGRLLHEIKLNLHPYLHGICHIHDPAPSDLVLYSPDYVAPSQEPKEVEIVTRIFSAYAKMKKDQATVSGLHRPSSLWQNQINVSFSYFTDALAKNDIGKFHFFLANFGCWKHYHGVESNMLMRQYMKNVLGRKFLRNVIFDDNIKTWNWFYNGRKSISALSYPNFGNHSGAYLGKDFIGVGSFFNEIYGSILSGLVKDVERPVVADLGAGYGKLAYFTLRDMANFCFLDFDLPETLCLASYYMMMNWPEKKTLLYGESDFGSNSQNEYDLIFMPSFSLEKMGNCAVDLFINTTSLGEMTRETAACYVGEIARSTKKYFFHMNHDIFPNVYSDLSPGLLGHEYPIPSDQFKLLMRYPDIGHMIHQGGLNYYMDIFLYLYERRF